MTIDVIDRVVTVDTNPITTEPAEANLHILQRTDSCQELPVSTMGTTVRVVVVDDHPFFRDGVTRGLQNSGYIRVIGEAGDGREGLEVIAREKPEVALVDYQMPDMDGIDLVHAVVRDGLATRVLLLSAVVDSAIVYRAVQEGAAGYLSKEARRSEIVDAVLRVSKGHTVVPPELAGGLVDQIRLRAQSDTPVLSERERQVLDAFARGLSIPQTAAELYVGASTVKTYTQRLYEKLGVSDRAAAVAEAMRRGLLD
jgi:two-component system, NarL family, nitrate/nitrite response regulator NarL